MKNTFFSLNLDFAGFITSMLCAVHCAALPFILAFSAVGTFSWLENPIVELTFIAGSVVFVSSSILKSYLSTHKNLIPMIIAGLGFMLIIVGHLEGFPEPVFNALGGISIASAHMVNWRECRSHAH